MAKFILPPVSVGEFLVLNKAIVIDHGTPFTTQNGQLRGDLKRKINEKAEHT